MVRLLQRDLHRLYSALSELNSDSNPLNLSKRTLSAVRTAVDCDFLAFDSFGDSGNYLDTQWNSDSSILTDELQSEFGRLFNATPCEHPLAHLLGGPPYLVQKFTDVVSQRDFEKTAIYNEFFRRIDLRYQTAFLITTDTGVMTSCAINRLSRDFNERERTILGFLAPQLGAAIRIAVELKKLYERETVFETILARSARAVVSVARTGRIIFQSRLGEELLKKYFGADLALNRIPPQLREWVESVFAGGPSSAVHFGPRYFRSGPDQLRIDAIFTENSNDLSLLLAEESEAGTDEFRRFGLTDRESEILRWVAKGKSDETIATLCGISTRTVQKHLEHIFRKLGVESRLAAVQLTRELLNS